MYEDRIGDNRDQRAVHSFYDFLDHHPNGPLDQNVDVVNHRSRLAAGHESSVGVVCAIRDSDDADAQSAGSRLVGQRPVLGEHDQRRIEGRDRIDDGARVILAYGNKIPELAVGSDVRQRRSVRDRKGVKGAELEQHVGSDLVLTESHRATSESGEVRKTRMRADADTARYAPLHGGIHGSWIACMESASDVGRSQRVEQSIVGAHGPRAETFAEIGDKIDAGCHFGPSGSFTCSYGRRCPWLVRLSKFCVSTSVFLGRYSGTPKGC